MISILKTSALLLLTHKIRINFPINIVNAQTFQPFTDSLNLNSILKKS
jgi:hypothetical protein